jgi:endogenous inhibitor of DNA gyrase (YacG/DUF329 family)
VFQLMRVSSFEAALVPEISGHRLMVQVRLMRRSRRSPPDHGRHRLRAHALRLSPAVPKSIPPRAPAVAPRIIRCPGCGGDSVYAASNPFRPFCSERCRGADFGAWASEGYRVRRRDRRRRTATSELQPD